MITGMLYFFLLVPVLLILGTIGYLKYRAKIFDNKKLQAVEPSENDKEKVIPDRKTIDSECKAEKITSKRAKSILKPKVGLPVQPIKKNSSFLVKSKTLKEEEPYAAVVFNDYIPFTCSKCFAWNPINDKERHKLKRCTGCRVLHYCSKECQQADWNDHQSECKFFRSSKGFVPHQTSRLVCRAIMKSKSQPEWKAFNGRTYDSLINHCETQRKSDHLIERLKDRFSELQKFMGAKAPDFETFFLHHSKIVINSFAICDGSFMTVSRGCGVYIGLSVLDHSCRPDTFVVFQGSKLLLRTTNENGTYSDKMTVSYLGASHMRNTEYRRAHLQISHCFTCMCEECLDVETDKKRTSGRPECCPDGWFSVADLRCSKCKKNVPSKLGEKAKEANSRLLNMWIRHKSFDELPEVTECIKLFENYKKILSDENTYLQGFAEMLALNAPDEEIRLRFADICLPHVRKLPFDDDRSSFLCYRFLLLNKLRPSFNDTREALNEALEAVKIVFGRNHELTLEFMEKQRACDALARRYGNMGNPMNKYVHLIR